MPNAPRWFTDALAAPREDHTVDVNGTPIHYLAWGDPAKPGLVLVHGGAAHAQWWSFLAPLLTRQYRVVAPDLAGHGDSGTRDHYARRAFADDVMGVIDDAQFIGPPVLAGHSMGGLITIVAASLYGNRLAGAIIVDAPVRRPDPESEDRADRGPERKPRIYPDLATALSRFRLLPAQPCENDYILDHVARTSVRQVEGGYRWKFDPRVFADLSLESMHVYLASVSCRVALVRGELSVVVPPETGEYMYELLERNAPVVEIPEAHHHLLLDQPLAFVTAMRALLADWEHSVPLQRSLPPATKLP
ncbi:MAG TPA: alpha/beta hydrolase [Polyangiaceae bacterium]|nr:alpha/beta hydrolase [Polyangiaceae bacterium]